MYVSRLAAGLRAGTAAVLAVAAAMALAAGDVSGASLELRFSRPLPKTTLPCPVRTGIPIAPGGLADGRNVRLLADGREIAVQSEVLARYNDRTVKWLLLDFQALPTSELTLEFGPGVRPKAPREPIRVVGGAKGITVDTGRLKATIWRKGQGFPDELYLDLNADGRYAEDERLAVSGAGRSNWMDFVHTPTIRSREVLSAVAAKAEPDASAVAIEQLEAETTGPLHAVVKVSGKYRYKRVGTTAKYPYAHPQYQDKMPKEVGRIPFVMRLHFYRGLGAVEVQHTFIYEGDPDRDFAESLGVAAPMPVSREAVVTLGTGDKPLSFRRGRAQQAGLLQTSADHFRIWRRLGGMPSGTLQTGARAPGWLDVSGRRWGVTAAIWRSWQNYPKGLHADFSSGRLKASLWPPEAGLMDLRRYTRQWGVSETGARDGVDPFAVSRHASRGVAKTHRVLFDFHPGSRKPAEVASRVSWFLQKPYAWPSAEHMCRTRSQVALAFSPAETGKYDELEKIINRCLDYMLFSRERFRWYGMFDYGDLQQCFQNVHPHGRWESDYGRWGWFNGDASSHKPPAALLTHFLRTGRRDIFDLFEAEVLHVIDVDMVNAEEYPWNNEGYRDMRGCTHRHNGQHWACFFVGSRGIQALWFSQLYYMTGDERVRDVMDICAQLAWQEVVAKTGGRGGHSSGRDVTWRMLYALERTGDTKWRDALVTKWPWVLDYNRGAAGPDDGEDDLEWARRPAQRALTPRRDYRYPGTVVSPLANGIRYIKDPGDRRRYRQALDKAVEYMKAMYGKGPQSLPPDRWPGEPGGRMQGNWNPIPNLMPIAIHAMKLHDAAKGGAK